jgi:hypothetical protein
VPDPLAAAVARLASDPATDPDVATWLQLLLRDDPAGTSPADAVDRDRDPAASLTTG